MPYQIIDWQDYQIYKDRRPPWICFHRTLLDNRKFQNLPESARCMLPMFWLLASENRDYKSGLIELSDEDIAYRLRITEEKVKKNSEILVTNGFIRVVRFDTELYETVPIDIDREEHRIDKKRSSAIKKPEGVSQQVFDDYLALRKTKKMPLTETAILTLQSEGKKAGMTLEQVMVECCNRGWGGFKAEWMKDKFSQSKKPVENKSNVRTITKDSL